MDDNKKEKLSEIGYKILACCDNCMHSEFPSPSSPWGTCEKHEYKHRKHTGEPRRLSICRCGVCFEYAPEDDGSVRFGAFGEFADFDE